MVGRGAEERAYRAPNVNLDGSSSSFPRNRRARTITRLPVHLSISLARSLPLQSPSFLVPPCPLPSCRLLLLLLSVPILPICCACPARKLAISTPSSFGTNRVTRGCHTALLDVVNCLRAPSKPKLHPLCPLLHLHPLRQPCRLLLCIPSRRRPRPPPPRPPHRVLNLISAATPP
jgi:hypothetical protein